MTRIELEDGKYVVEHDDGAGLHALRNGQPWRDLTGDNLVLAMAQEIENLRKDAQRYRWLMSQEEWPEMVDYAVECLGVDMIDLYIDEAMSEVKADE